MRWACSLSAREARRLVPGCVCLYVCLWMCAWMFFTMFFALCVLAEVWTRVWKSEQMRRLCHEDFNMDIQIRTNLWGVLVPFICINVTFVCVYVCVSPHVTEFVQFRVHISLSEYINASRSEVCVSMCFCIHTLWALCLAVCVCIYLTAFMAPTGVMQRPFAAVHCPLSPTSALLLGICKSADHTPTDAL